MTARPKNLLQEFQPNARREEALGALFHEASKLTPERRTELGARIAHLQSRPDLLRRMTCSYKNYPQRPQIALPKASLDAPCALGDIVMGRRSTRRFDATASLDLSELANLLQLSYGITGSLKLEEGTTQYLRAIPSGGGLYPLEIYLLAERVIGLEPGLYHYRVAHHALEQLERGPQTERLQKSETEWGMIASAAVDIFVAAVFDRVAFKYRDRGYRFALMEAGMLAERLTTLGECQKVRSCIMGGWVDDEVNGVFGLDGASEAVVIALCMGK